MCWIIPCTSQEHLRWYQIDETNGSGQVYFNLVENYKWWNLRLDRHVRRKPMQIDASSRFSTPCTWGPQGCQTMIILNKKEDTEKGPGKKRILKIANK